MKDFLFGLPKTDLHIHIEGAMEPLQILEFAERHNAKVPFDTEAKVKQRMSEAFDLPSFIEVRSELLSVMQGEREFYEASMAYFKRSAAQGVVYVEMFFDPQCHTNRGLTFDEVMAGLVRAQRDAEKELGLRSKLIMCFNRELSAESAMATFEDSLRFKDKIIGVGLDNPGVEGFIDKFADVYVEAKKAGYRLTTHCDIDQKESQRNIRGALHTLKVERIDHGGNILEDVGLVQEALARGIGFTACPIKFYPRVDGVQADDLWVYRRVNGFIKQMLEQGLLVTLGTDDPGMFMSQYCGDIYVSTQHEMKLSQDQMVTLARNGFRMAWLSESEKAAYFDQIASYVQRANPALLPKS